MICVYYTKYELNDHENKYQKEHRIGLSLLDYGLKKMNVDFSEEDISLTDTGKPFLINTKDIYFNISHCDGWVVCAISNQEVGVDIERVGYMSDAMVKKVLNESESKLIDQNLFYRFWTLKESYLKWCGQGFYMDPRMVEFKIIENDVYCLTDDVYCVSKSMESDCLLAITTKERDDIKYEFYEKKMDGINCELFD